MHDPNPSSNIPSNSDQRPKELLSSKPTELQEVSDAQLRHAFLHLVDAVQNLALIAEKQEELGERLYALQLKHLENSQVLVELRKKEHQFAPKPSDRSGEKLGETELKPPSIPKLADENPHLITNIARVCHEVNREYCKAMGDHSQEPWERAPQWQKDSAIEGVKFHINNPNVGPEASHVSWMAGKLKEGWQYGPTKDPANKLHPCMVPFESLPKEQQAKDYIFRSIIHSILF